PIYNFECYVGEIAQLVRRHVRLFENGVIWEGCTAVCKEIAPQERDLGHQRCRFVEKRVDLGGLGRNQNGFLRLFGQALQIYGAVSPLEQRGNVDYERHKMRVRIECKERAETFCYVDRRRMGLRVFESEP